MQTGSSADCHISLSTLTETRIETKSPQIPDTDAEKGIEASTPFSCSV